MAWGLSSSLTTQTIPSVATPISQAQLTEGDVLDYNSTINPTNGSHVVMFVSWANPQHTEYTEDEEAGGGLGAVQRTIPYPYDVSMDGSGHWIPYRYNNIEEPQNWSYTPATVYNSAAGLDEVYYRGSDGDITENFWQNGQLHLLDLGHQMAATSSPSALYDSRSGQTDIFYTGSNGDLQESWWPPSGSVNFIDLDLVPTGNPAALYQPAARLEEVYYRGSDGDITENFWQNGQLHLLDLGHQMAATSSPSALYDANSRQTDIFYPGGNGDLQQSWWPASGSVNFIDLGVVSTGNPAALYTPAASLEEVYYRGSDGDITRSFWANGQLHLVDLGHQMASTSTASPSALYDLSSGQTDVFYPGSNGDLQESWWPASGSVNFIDLGVVTTGSPAALYNPGARLEEVYYRGSDGDISRSLWQAGQLHFLDLGQLIS